jgi:DNA-entry nuclease
MSRRKKHKSTKLVLTIVIMAILAIAELYLNEPENTQNEVNEVSETNEINYGTSYELADIPEYTDEPYVVLNNNVPNFEESDFTTESFENYSQLDKLGRCGVAFANLSKETMPKDGEERTDISKVKPTGWQSTKYDIVNGKYLYNRCHLIAYSLSDENANEKNLITGTRYFNVDGMLPYETKVLNYLKENTDKHVLYRVTPIYEGDNLVANGVTMEAESVEDKGKSICFYIYVYNVQPGITIDYATGNSKLAN